MRVLDRGVQAKMIKIGIPNAGVGQERAAKDQKTRKTDTGADLEIGKIATGAAPRKGTKDVEVDQVIEQRDEKVGLQSSEAENEIHQRN